MRLGLIGTGKQGQRYLQEKNGGRHIVVSGSRRIPLDDVDGVIIATHPAGHRELALEAIAAGKSVLIEKPLALNLRDCMDIIDAAEKAKVRLMVAHTHLWSHHLPPATFTSGTDAECSISYASHSRDYSAWLDWGPHALSLVNRFAYGNSAAGLLARVAVYKSDETRILLRTDLGDYWPGCGSPDKDQWMTPMWRMTHDFRIGRGKEWNEDYRRVYRALFAEE